jgi:hypothetical protein
VPGGQLLHALVDRERRGHVLERQVGVQRLHRHRGRRPRIRDERAELRREHEPVGSVAVEERLLAKAVTCEQQGLPSPVPHREREHPAQQLRDALAHLLVEVRDDLGVAAAAEAVPLGLQVLAQLRVVVDLAVDDDGDLAVLVRHRLAARLGQIDDREPAVAERDGAVGVEAEAVGPAVHHRGREELDGSSRRRVLRAPRERPGDPAH